MKPRALDLFCGAGAMRACRFCNATFPVLTRSDANRQHCSRKCSRDANRANVKAWLDANPGSMSKYNSNRVIKNPGAWREKHRSERNAAIELLGGKCVVCGADYRPWLELDYIPTTRGQPFRHPRGVAYVRRNAGQFRVLCANHHRELTTTGRIAGTEITQ